MVRVSLIGRRSTAVAGLLIALSSVPARAAQFASSVASYDKGAYAGPLVNTAAAVGQPAGIVGASGAFPGVLSPFNPHYETSEIVGIGAGGQITFALPNPVNSIAGPEIGVFNNVGFVDTAYPTGQAGSPPGFFNALARVADVEVSANGSTFTPVGRFTFQLPSNYYTNASGPFDSTAPSNPQFADFGKPFTGSLNDFSGENFSQILATLDGSAGGTWIDFSSTGLASVSFIRFSIPTGGIAGSDNRAFFDAISVANTAATPEPAGAAVLLLAALAARRKR